MINIRDLPPLKISLFNKMDERKQLSVLISCISSILTTALLLLQLHAVVALKIARQQSNLRHLQNEAIMSRNIALARYHSARKR
jgi:hypothetical protein